MDERLAGDFVSRVLVAAVYNSSVSQRCRIPKYMYSVVEQSSIVLIVCNCATNRFNVLALSSLWRHSKRTDRRVGLLEGRICWSREGEELQDCIFHMLKNTYGGTPIHDSTPLSQAVCKNRKAVKTPAKPSQVDQLERA